MDTYTPTGNEVTSLTPLHPSTDGSGGGGARNGYARLPRQPRGKPTESQPPGDAVQLQLSPEAAARLGQDGPAAAVKSFGPAPVYAEPRPQSQAPTPAPEHPAAASQNETGPRSKP